MSKGYTYTVLDYYALPDEISVELIGGRYFEVPVKGTLHQSITSYFHVLIGSFVRDERLDCKLYDGAVNVMILQDDYNMLQPDFMVVSDRSIIGKREVYGSPDFIAEILTDDTRCRALDAKLDKYQEAGVKELWVIDTQKRKLITYINTVDGFLTREYGLNGELPIAMFEGKLKVSLDEIRNIIDEYEVMKD